MAANDDDDETTIAVEEELEKTERTKDTGEFESDPVRQEIAQLEAEASMPIEALLSRIGYDPTSEENGPRSVGSEEPMDTGSVENEQSDSEHSSAELSSSSVTEGSISLKDLLSEGEDSGHKGTKAEPLSDFRDSCDKIQCIPNSEVDTQQSEELKNLESLTAEAMEAQPTQSTTLSSAGSAISTPFLLSGGTLREYQLVGLGWLAAIYQKRLNGILADEMGLGKTIQTIALLAHLACEHGIWGPHLIVVPTSVILNWEMEFKRWCPGFKIISYFGHAKERKERRKGWTKTNAFHVCITSYRLAIQDASVFKRKKWKYLILDEAQNIKNFKSQRWQTLLTFNSQRRLLLTGTPLQNSLMELWSLMHFLMPNIFQSHRDFQEWFASPLTGMIEGNSEYNEQLVARLHKVLRPFLLRRLKADVERQLPKKFEHVVMCRLSRRQRFLYDDFMSLSSTRDTLTSGQFLSVMNVLMQLRKVCNHPNLFETRPILSPFHIDDGLLTCPLPRLLSSQSHPFLVLAPVPTNQASPCSNASAFNDPDLDWLDRAGAAARLLGQATNLAEMARDLPTFVHRRCRELCPRTDLFMAVDSIDVVDEVKNQRKSLSEHAQRVGSSPFFSADVIKVVDEERRRTSSFYIPSLRDPLPIQPVVVEAEASARPCNVGMPKSIIRHRANERRARLALLARINSRRCGLVETKQIRASQSVEMFDFGTPLGPDLFEVVRRMCSDQSPAHRTVYPGLIDGRRRCQQSLLYWPSQCYLQRRITKCSPIDQAGCLAGAPLKVSSPYLWTDDCTPLRMLLNSPADYLSHLEDILNRFSFVIPPVTSRGPLPHLMCPKYQHQVRHQSDRIEELLRSSVVPSIPQQSIPTRHGGRSSLSTVSVSSLAWLLPTQLHRIATACRIQFPDPRLIQYDCGKLQRLDLLLRELKAGCHRVLIFTQMARMLDILEQFLAYHGHRYLRLDGTTKVEQRQVLMERFNQDNQIFAFILSTRSGGLGVNLTGADTVVFYDSDWNPTMDAQAQDRCHRIGQTRDVHIYRLISERTVEENILRKANQKRFLSDVAIEGGRFTTAFFKQNTITELFAEPTGLQDLVTQKETAPSEPSSPHSPVSTPDTSAQPVVVTRSGRQVRPRGDPSVLAALAPSQVAPGTLPDENQLTALLEACEDENDRMAAERALAEAKADLAEFDETIPLEPAAEAPATDAAKENEPDPFVQFAMKRRQNLQTEAAEAAKPEVEESVHVQKDMNKLVEDELAEFESTLRPVERLAVRQLEQQREDSLNEELEMADVMLSESKEAWRLDQMKALHMADEEKAEIEEDDMLYCYGAYDPEAQQKAELERLEKLIAEEEAALQSSSRARKRKAVGTRSTERAETPSDREAAPAKDDDVNPPPSVTETDYVGHPRTRKDTTDRLAKRSLYVDASSSDSCSSVSSSDTEVFIPRRGRPSLDKGRLQRFEDHSIPKQKTVKTKQSASSTTSSERDKDFFSKRKAHPSPDITASKVPRIDTTFRSMISRRGRPRKSAMIPNVFDRSRRPLPSLRHDQLDTPEMVEQTARAQSDVIVLPDRVTFDDKAHPNQFRFGKRHPHILRHPSATSTASPSVTGNYPFGQTQPIHRNFTVFQRAPHPSNEPPASIAKPPEPLIPVQSVVNGMRSSVPAGQLFTPTGQPVFVITRQLKTPNGKIYQQRFTHPVIPPPQFSHAVQRLTHPIKSQPIRTILPVTSQPTLVSGHSVARVASIPRPTISPLTIPLRLNTVSPGATLTNGIQGQPAGYGSSIATSSTAQQTNIRVSPVVRVWPSGSNTMPSQTQSNTNVVARPRIQVLDNLVDHAVSKLRVIYPKQTKHDTS